MKKVYPFVSLIVVSVLVVLHCARSQSKTFDGYSYSLEDARAEETAYQKYDYLFTAQEENVVIDFIVDGDVICIVQIHYRGEPPKTQYKVRSVTKMLISQNLYYSQTQDAYEWSTTGKYLIPVEWSAVSREFDDSHDKLGKFEFVYNDEPCRLCYRIGK